MDGEGNHDPAAERGVLAGVFKHGRRGLVEVDGLIDNDSFYIASNQLLFEIAKHAIGDDINARLDLPAILSAARSLGFDQWLTKGPEIDHLRAVMAMNVELSNLPRFAGKVRKLAETRRLREINREVEKKLAQVTGDETITQILAIPENAFLDFSASLGNRREGPEDLGSDIDEYIQYLIDNPVEQVGLSSGYPQWDKAIGGGLRRKTVNMIAARAKAGKAQHDDCLVMCPNGPRPIREIRPGDWVCGPLGQYHRVDAVHPQGEIQLYKVEFENGDSTLCCLDHLWLARHPDREQFQLYTTRQLKAEAVAWEIPLPRFCKFERKEVEYNPYLVGHLLAYGQWRDDRPTFYFQPENYHRVVNTFPAELGPSHSWSTSWLRFSLTGERGKTLQEFLLKFPLLEKRSIPDVYRFNSRGIRLKVLRGILDRSAKVMENGIIRWRTEYPVLAGDVGDLVQSLGGVVKITRNRGDYHLTISYPRPAELFLLREVDLNLTRQPVRRIKRIRRASKHSARCLTVHGSNGLYLTDHSIVTHNSFLADNMAVHVCRRNIPVLMLDTELCKTDHHNRILANLSGVELELIETGKFRTSAEMIARVKKAGEQIKAMPYQYLCVAGMPFEEIAAFMRRWVHLRVGFNDQDRTHDCLVIYDYVKMMSADFAAQRLQETQAMGFLMTALHNFTIKNDLPCVTFCQTNREGLTSDELSAIAASDRITWFASNVSILMEKDETELAEDIEHTGGDGEVYTMKLVQKIARHGKGLGRGDYINLVDERNRGILREGPTRNQLYSRRGRGLPHVPQPQA